LENPEKIYSEALPEKQVVPQRVQRNAAIFARDINRLLFWNGSLKLMSDSEYTVSRSRSCRELESVHTIKWTGDSKEKYFSYKQKHIALYLSVNECDTNAQHSYKLFMGQN
jgi:hypothetical protein